MIIIYYASLRTVIQQGILFAKMQKKLVAVTL